MKIQDSYLLLLGLFAGFSSAALGIGGGVVIVPALLVLFKFDIKVAIGTSLATIASTTFVGILFHYAIASDNIEFLVAPYLIIGAIIGSKIGTVLAHKIHSRILTILFSLLLIFIGLKLTGVLEIPIANVPPDGLTYPLLIILGFFAGAGSALFGIGGGVILVPTLNLVFGLPIHHAIATSLTVIFPTTVAGYYFHKKFEKIDISIVKLLVPSAAVGAIFGAFFANAMPADTLRLILGAFMILASVKLFFQKQD